MGSRIVVAATLSSTLNPTRDLVRATGREVGKEIQVEELLCTAAWHKLEAGDREGYYDSIAEELASKAAEVHAVVLAQASMAPAMERCELKSPVLTSPRSGFEEAIEAYRMAS